MLACDWLKNDNATLNGNRTDQNVISVNEPATLLFSYYFSFQLKKYAVQETFNFHLFAFKCLV